MRIGISLGLTQPSSGGSGEPPALTYDFYVATTGNDANAGTAEAPWKTLKKLTAAYGTAKSGKVSALVKAGTYDAADDYLEISTSNPVANDGFDITFETGCTMDGTAANLVAPTNGLEFNTPSAWPTTVYGNGLVIQNYKDALGPSSPNGVSNRGNHQLTVYNVRSTGCEDGFSAHGSSQMHLYDCIADACTKAAVAHVDTCVVTHTRCQFTGGPSGLIFTIGSSVTSSFTDCTFVPGTATGITPASSTFTRCQMGTLTASISSSGANNATFTKCFVNLFMDGDRTVTLNKCFGKFTSRVRPGGVQNILNCVFSTPATGQGAIILGTSDLSGAQALTFNNNIAKTATAAAFMNMSATVAGHVVSASASFANNALNGSAAYDADLIAADTGGTVVVGTVTADTLIGPANTLLMADYAYGSGSPAIGAGTGGGNIGFGAADVEERQVA